MFLPGKFNPTNMTNRKYWRHYCTLPHWLSVRLFP